MILPHMIFNNPQPRQALKEKIAKLLSPFLNFTKQRKLRIWTLTKHVDKVALNNLVVEAIVKRLSQYLVQPDNQVTPLRSLSDMTTQEILKLMEISTEIIFPKLSEKRIKESVPLICDDSNLKNKRNIPFNQK